MENPQRDQIQDKIHEAAEKFAEAIEKVAGDGARVGVFYVYLTDDEWRSGNAGNMNLMERCGATTHLADREKFGDKDDY